MSAPVEMTYVGIYRERPPRARLFFDVGLHNDEPAPRWFLLPYKIANPPPPLATEVDILETYRLGDQGQVTVGHFGSIAGFHALLLPGHGEVTLRRFPLAASGELPDQVTVPVVIARDLAIGGEPARAWFAADPTTPPAADVPAEALRDQSQVKAVKHSPDRRPLPVRPDLDRHVEVAVDLRRR